MKATIDKLAVGKIEYNTPNIELSVNRIEDTVETGNYFDGNLSISGVNEALVKGVVYSTNSRIEIITPQFNSVHSVIKFSVNTMDICDGEHVKGNICIVSNAGEFVVSIDIKVLDYVIESSIGKIENFFHFTNLVQLNYEEAYKLFVSKDFKRLLAKNDVKDMSLYEGLIKSIDKHLALEQFLIAINKKKPIVLELANKDKCYKGLEENFADVVTLTRSTWGYTDISVEIQGGFLKECKGKIRKDDFTGNKYDYRYLIDFSELYKGVNYGKIIFIGNKQRLEYQIEINNDKLDIDNIKQTKDYLIKLTELYLEFRMKKITMSVWVNESIDAVDNILNIEPENKMALLMKSQVLISQTKQDLATEILDNFAKTKLVDMDKNLDIYCYFLYVRSLEKREVTYNATVLAEVKKLYEQENNWRMLWVLLYMDERYDINKSLKYTMIKEQFTKGCRSPLMYFEALNILNEQPRLLRILNKFEVQILLFGIKHNFVNKGLAEQVTELAVGEKKYNISLYNLLTGIYKQYPNSELLTAICGIIIRGNRIGEEYLEWYRLGVEVDVRLTNMYEYYVMSLPEDYEDVMPKIVYMYFVYNGDALGSSQAFLYSNVIRNKRRIPNIYNRYVKIMEEYLVDQLFHGNMNRHLAVIYSDMIKSSVVNADIAKNLPDIVMTYEIICEDDNMKEAVIIHKEIIGESVYRINGNRAYVSIYTEEATVIFADASGRRYSNVKYELKQLLDMQEYLVKCLELHNDNRYLLLHFAEKYTKYSKNLLSSLEEYKGILNYSNVKSRYKQEILREIVGYYYDNSDDVELEQYLIEMDKSKMDGKTREKVITMMLNKGLYQEAYEEIGKYGYYNIDTHVLSICCTRIIESSQYIYDTLLLEMSMLVFRDGKYNEAILEYLSRYFSGTVEEMVGIWKADNDFVYENHQLEERILAQVMFTKNYSAKVKKVFESYYRYGIGKVIKLAYYTFASYSIFLKKIDRTDREEKSYIFEYIERDMINGMGVSNICKLALLEHVSKFDKLSDNQKELYHSTIMKLSNYNVIFEFYKKFVKWFDLPFYITDKVIVDYRTNPGSKVSISYTIGNEVEETQLIVEPMSNVLSGVYIKDFTLFYGDKLNYYINETRDEETITSEGHKIEVTDSSVYKDGSRHSMLNHILMAEENGDQRGYNETVEKFASKKQISETVFDIC